MRMFNLSIGISASLLLISIGTEAHTSKPNDLNGGHWDDSGRYHCHLVDICVEAPARYQFRSRAISNNNQDLYYLQEDWPYWQLAAGCKTIRTVVLENTSRVPVTWTNPRQCEIREGLWIDEYTGEEFTRAAALEVDHVISPQYANAANGYQWDLGKRTQFANDPYNLIPVGRETHRKKRERSIGAWQPRDDFQCEYAANWRDVAEKYELDLFSRDQSRIKRIMENCSEEVGPGAQD